MCPSDFKRNTTKDVSYTTHNQQTNRQRHRHTNTTHTPWQFIRARPCHAIVCIRIAAIRLRRAGGLPLRLLYSTLTLTLPSISDSHWFEQCTLPFQWSVLLLFTADLTIALRSINTKHYSFYNILYFISISYFAKLTFS